MITTILLSATAEHANLEEICSNFFNNWNNVSTMEFISLIVFFIVACFLLMYSAVRKHIIKNLMPYACAIFIAGFILYFIGFNGEGNESNTIALFFRSVTASMEMFVSESELIEVEKGAKESQLYMSFFAVTHFLAICISAAFILHILGIRAISYLKMRLTWRRQKKDLYVFFDLSQESVNLAKDICKSNNEGKGFRIVFVKTPMEDSHLERFSFSHILSFADNRNETIEELMEINALLTYSRKSITIGMDDKEWEETIGLNILRNYIKKYTEDIYFFCLSANEENNINTAVELSKRYLDNERHHIYCRANRDSITESLASSNLKFIDSANLAVMELKNNVTYQPVSFVNPDTKTAVATKHFRSMIIGFGETGFEVFCFLYEFSSFVGKDSKENPFHCDIIDPKADQLENSLYLHCPALEDKEDSDKSHCISFHKGTIEDNRRMIEELIKDVDYVVVCTDNEKENLSIGITLLKLAYKYRKHSNRLAIFIGINNNREFQKAQEIARFYDECGRRDGNGNLYDFSLVPFGAKKQLFTYKNIIGDDILKKAQTFYYEYQKTATLLDTEYEGQLSESPQKEWQDRETNEKKDVKGATGLYYKNELLQKESQDIANAWHIKTKLYLSGVCYNCKDDAAKCYAKDLHYKLYECINTVMQKLLERMKEARNHHEKFTKSHQFILEQISIYEKEHDIPVGEYQTLFENLAKCEHLRWNASNRLLGYRTFENTTSNDKHYLQKTHACIVPYEDLLANEVLRDTIKYDYNTILVSMIAYLGNG